MQFEQLQSFIKWNPKQVDASTSLPVKPICLPSPTQSNQVSAQSPSAASHSEGTWPQHTPNTPIPLGLAASATETNLKQQNEIDTLRAELERKRVEVHQLRLRCINVHN